MVDEGVIVMKYPMNIDAIHVPQREYVKGDNLFNMTMDDPLLPKKTDVKPVPWNSKVDTWMVSCPPAWIKTGYTGNFYRFSDEAKEFVPRVEVLLGNYIHDHSVLQIARGTQPFGSYLRGHINSCREYPELFPRRSHDFIDVQHYYRSDRVPGDITEDQVYMTCLGLKVLLVKGFIRDESQVLCFDKSWPLDQYVVDDAFITVSVKDILTFWEETPYEEALRRWKKFSEWGKTYGDRKEALSQISPLPRTLVPVEANKERIYEVAREVISKLGIRELIEVWIWKSRVAGTSQKTSDVDLWIQVKEDYCEECEGFESKLGYPYETRVPGLDYNSWKYPLLVYYSARDEVALDLEAGKWGLPLDIHVGCGLPPKSPFRRLSEV